MTDIERRVRFSCGGEGNLSVRSRQVDIWGSAGGLAYGFMYVTDIERSGCGGEQNVSVACSSALPVDSVYKALVTGSERGEKCWQVRYSV